MKTLPKSVAQMISNAYNTLGKDVDSFFLFEEKLTFKQATPVYNFMRWIDDNDKEYSIEISKRLFQEYLVS